MGKKLIRLTESDLHRIVKESVNRVLNEVQFGGESLHGNNPGDWAAMRYLRTDRIAHENNAGLYDDDESGYVRNVANWARNGKNEIETLDKIRPHDYSKYVERVRGLHDKGRNKANRISKKIGYKK